MFKKAILILAGIFLFFWGDITLAEVVINEVQLNPTEERFIELYNSGNSPVDLTNWYIQRKTANGTFGSLVTKTDFENKTINADEYFLISRTQLSKSDLVISNITLTESNTIQIKNKDGDLVGKVGWGDTNDCANPCVANPTDGKSIQRSLNGWIIASSTPGMQNISNSTLQYNDSTVSLDANSSTQITSEIKTKTSELPTIKTKIFTKNLAFVGVPFELKANNFGFSGEVLNYGKCFWNFGDGDSKEQKNNFDKFSHTYLYPGEYTVSLEYFSNHYSEIPDAINKVIIKVVPLSVTISKVGDEKDFFIELTNNSDFEIDISKWILASLDKVFIFPRNTILLSKGKMILSPQITNFIIDNKKDLKLIKPTGEIVFDYGNLNIYKQSYSSNATKDFVLSSANSKDISLKEINKEDNIQKINNDFSAATINSDITSNDKNSYLFFVGFVVLLIVSGTIVYFIRQRKIIPQEGDDFEILDE